jgi:hypothetical protein
VERSAPGIAALFADLSGDGSHSVLDLGSASEANFELYRRFARRIRFADLLGFPTRQEPWPSALGSLPPASDQPYDLVLVWNLLDLVPRPARSQLMERLTQLTTSGARLYLLVDASGAATTPPLRFTIRGMDRVVQQPLGDPVPAGPELLPAEVERLVRPFQVIQAFTLRPAYREYVAERT